MHFFESVNFGQVPWAGLPFVVWILILLALTFDFLNGMHDAANSVATVVSTRVLSPRTAILWAAFFNFVAFLVFPLKVAKTIQGGIVDQHVINEGVIAATLVASCGWNLITWYWGLPTSSSHALIGGLVGAALASRGDFTFLAQGSELGLIILFIILAPLIGMVMGVGIALGITWMFRHATPGRVDKVFRRGQLVSAALFSLGHGGNDAQKTMGIIFVLLLATLKPPVEAPQPVLPGVGAVTGGTAAVETKARPPEPALKEVPTEVVLSCHLAMALGTMIGGWRIVKTMGQRIIRLRPVDGFGAETAAAATLAMTTFFKGIPISTTHTITGAIVGVGSLKRFSAVRWGVAGRVVWAWVLTIPGSALLAILVWWLLHLLGWTS